MEVEDKFMRLPTSTKPLLYNIYMKCDVGTFEFNGTETITLAVYERLLLHLKIYVIDYKANGHFDASLTSISSRRSFR